MIALNRRRVLSGAGVGLLGACANVPPSTDAPAREIDAALQALLAEGQAPGFVVLIGRGDRVLYRAVLGWQDLEQRTPMREDTIFRLYSMSKPIASAAILALADRGALSLHDPATRFLPEFANMRVYAAGGLADMQTVPVARPITIDDLLTHRSGITYHFAGEGPVHQYYRAHGVMRDTPVGRRPSDAPPAPNLDELVRRIGGAPLLHQPGEQFAYSYSTTVLGAVIERATNKRLDAALDELIFSPLGMSDTGFFIDEADAMRFMTNYAMTPNGLLAIETPQTSDYRDRGRLLDAGGAIAGTAENYYRFARMLAEDGSVNGHQILQPQALDLMCAPHVRVADMTADGRAFEFGYGLQIGDAAAEAAGQMPAGSVGWSGSGNTYFWADRRSGGVVVFMTQVLTGPDSQALAARLRQVVTRRAMSLIEAA